MARCAICEKGAHFGNTVSHSHRRANKMWKANIQSVRVKLDNGGNRRINICTSCLRSGYIERA
ncbi:MAG: 50S ribosomal protein L28 [Lachnospiraceae bacterium]|nr:50S ribosomal protein L28 [Lachnospiraceae bacterium]MBQ3967420.1 50S ribosomal protein L28 [Lachnospiraceae bacterium]MBR4588703.1 50S ribosomal protein L28 [Lachnospiraceae bacterium]MCR4927629.1 50S ribosomal protein L28 [Lachnospiraceae bacterium]